MPWSAARDPSEVYVPVKPAPGLVVETLGAEGGRYRATGAKGTFAAAPLPGPRVCAYGAGDSFAAGLTFALGSGYGVADALRLASRCGAACVTGRGPYERQLTAADL
jgi:ribokinase